MTEKQRKDRQKRSDQLEVKEIAPHTYLVQSQSDPSMYHKVTLDGTPSCSCQDWRRHHEADPAWACKHLLAARDLAESNGNGRAKFTPEEKARIQADIDALFGARPSAPRVDPQPPVPQLQEELTPCSECGQLLPAAQMIPWSAPGGSGLLCEECHQAHKEIQAELKAEAGTKGPSQEPDALQVQEETQVEPGTVSAGGTPFYGAGILPQPTAHCALCGGESPLAGDPSLPCKSCELKAQERIGSPRRDTLPEPQDNHGSMDPPSGIPMEIPEPEEEILPTLEGPWEEAIQLESCLVCHAKAPTDEMILVSVPSGTGLVCRTCYDGRKACPGPWIKSRAGSDPGACAFCGTRLPIEQLITVPTSSGAGLLCEGCYVKSRACSRCGDHFLVERMIAIREPGFFGYYCPECAKEYEAERAREAKVGGPHPVGRGPTLADRIAQVNEVLASFGNAAIEKVKVKNRQGEVVKELFGYGLQYTLDAVNAAIGPDAWRYKILEWRAIEGGKGALVLIELEIWDGARWHSHDPMFGTTALSDEGDGLKGAIGDALKKSLAYWGIGNLAYRGELRMAKA